MAAAAFVPLPEEDIVVLYVVCSPVLDMAVEVDVTWLAMIFLRAHVVNVEYGMVWEDWSSSESVSILQIKTFLTQFGYKLENGT